jgi:hypothetical protein
MPDAIRNPKYGKAHKQTKPAPPGYYGDTDCGAPARRLVEMVDLADVAPNDRCLRCWPDSTTRRETEPETDQPEEGEHA